MRRASLRAGLAIAVLLTACPGNAPGPPAGERGGTLRVVLREDVDSLDPHAAGRPSSWFFARALHRGLLAFPARADGRSPVPDLATMRPAIAAGPLRRFRFELRAGVRWGAPLAREVTAADVRWSIERVVKAGRGVARFLDVIEGAPSFRRGAAGRLAGIRVRSDRVLVIRTRVPAADLPWVLAHPQLAVLPAGTPPPGRVDPVAVPGLGPYRIDAYEPERRINLVRNPAWTRDDVRSAYPDAVEGRIEGRPSDPLPPDADLIVEPGPADVAAGAGPDARAVGTQPACVRYLFLNPATPPLGDVRVRRAVASAVRREALPGAHRPAPRLLPPVDDANAPDPVLAEDADAARARLRAAGLRRGFSITITVARSARDVAEARALARALGRVGIALRIFRVPAATLHAGHYATRRATAGLATWCADWPGRAGRNVLGSIADPRAPAGTNYAGAALPRLAAAIDEANGAGDPAASAARWRAADRLAVRSAVVIPLLWPVERVELSERLAWVGSSVLPRGDPAAMWLR